MADFRTHIATSTVVGIGYAAAGHYLGMPWPSCLLAGGLCSVAGMLPDIDSDTGVPRRESIAFAAAVVPMLLMERFHEFGLAPELIALAGAGLYLFIRFGVGWFIGAYTVHRGMWHSVPAAIMAGLFAFLLSSGLDVSVRIFKGGAVTLGYLTHLMLDELWSIEFNWGIPRLKRSFGTAMKFWSDSAWANFSTYSKLAFLAVLAIGDPLLMNHLGLEESRAHRVANELIDKAKEKGDQLLR